MLHKFRTLFADVTPRLIFVAIYASLGSVSQGFDSAWWGNILGATAFNDHFGSVTTVNADGSVSHSLSTSDISIGTGLGMAFGMIGGIAIAYPMEHWGRRKSLWTIASVFLVGITIEAVATIPASYACLIVGKCIVSMGTGLSAGSICAYLSECSPASVRGILVAVYINIQTVGSICGEIVVYCVVNRTNAGNWLYPICMQAIFPILFLIGIPFLPESPRWLVAKGRVEEAEKEVRKLRNWSDEAVHEEVVQMAIACEEERLINAHYGWLDLWRGTNLKRTMTAIGTQCLQQSQGLSFILSYLVLTLQRLGFNNSQIINFMMYIIQFVCTGTSIITSDLIGRRRVLLIGSTVMAITMFVIGGVVSYTENPTGALGKLTLAMYLLWMFACASSWLPVAFILGSEVPAQGLRDKTLSTSIWCSYGNGLLIIMSGPYIVDAGYGNLGTKIDYVFGVVSIIAVVWTYFMAPELKGRSLEEIDYMFQERVPIKDFHKFDTSAMIQQRHEQAMAKGFDDDAIASEVLAHPDVYHAAKVKTVPAEVVQLENA
ncbi:hypothetical protein SCUCBS95973_008513 [Sporothrix curviconia]|uniref:Major facilitator superfamily (MFS) profile domain-containing protein n=1 Tax=Sporothrix curviconia TaxID=1260050 RepID=A0ABP0CM73_9PEZI